MSRLLISLYFHSTPLNGLCRRDLILNSQNLCRSIITGAENLSLSSLCYGRLSKSWNRRALMLMARNDCFNSFEKKTHNYLENRDEGKDTNAHAHKKQKVASPDSVNKYHMVTPAEASASHRPLINCPKTKEIWMELKDKLKCRLEERLREITKHDFSGMEHGLEIVDSLYLLKLFNISNPEFEAFVQNADDGEQQLREGLKQAQEGYKKLKIAVSDVLGNST